MPTTNIEALSQHALTGEGKILLAIARALIDLDT